MITRLEKEVEMLDRHLDLLRLIIDYEVVDVETIAMETGRSPHTVRYSLRVLETEDLITVTDQKVTITDQTAAVIANYNEQLDQFASTLEDVRITPPESRG